MDFLSKEELEELANISANHCISVYIHTHQSGMEVNELKDPLIFKNKLDEAHDLLEKEGLSEDDIQQIMQPGFDLIHHEEFWHNQLQSPIVFMADQFFKIIKSPVPLNEHLYTGHSFYLVPLLPVLHTKKQFFLLALSKNDATFYKGNVFGLQKQDVEGLPNGMNDVIYYEKKGGKQLFRKGGSNAEAGFHGEGSGLADEKEYVAKYLKEVDDTLMDHELAVQEVPLVLAGVKDVAAAYQQISNYRHIAEETITGNQENEDINTLFDKAKELLRSYFKEDVQKALDNYYNNVASAFTSSTAADIIPASFYGRVADLFIQENTYIWGAFDDQNNELQLHPERETGDDCLLNKAAIKTWLNEGNVYVLEKEQMPNGSAMAAFFRYEMKGQ